ncbi:MAG: DNA-processing protein DprA [Treponema sp.]|nr:DNA-processing protein DprA [Treponema sp.]
MCSKHIDELLALCISGISFLTFKEKNILQNNIDSLSALAVLSIHDISRIVGRSFRSAQWDGKRAVREAERSARILNAFNITMLPYAQSAYPALLREIANPPFALFYRGNANCLGSRTVSVVGTRRMTAQGKQAAFSFARDAACDGVTVVSGLANGIDGEAHKGALESCFDAMEAGAESGKTCAILPCGCDMIVPASHKKLAEKILATGGALVSEYLPGTPSQSWRFVHRNRIIAALSPATVVIEAPPGSGALHTAQFALDCNRDVLFHESAFSKSAATVAERVKQKLENDFALGKVSKSKLESTVERYRSDGAPVIKDYDDYCHCRAELPGMRNSKTIAQEQLF